MTSTETSASPTLVEESISLTFRPTSSIEPTTEYLTTPEPTPSFPTEAIIGIAVGCTAFLLVLVLVLYFTRRKCCKGPVKPMKKNSISKVKQLQQQFKESTSKLNDGSKLQSNEEVGAENSIAFTNIDESKHPSATDSVTTKCEETLTRKTLNESQGSCDNVNIQKSKIGMNESVPQNMPKACAKSLPGYAKMTGQSFQIKGIVPRVPDKNVVTLDKPVTGPISAEDKKPPNQHGSHVYANAGKNKVVLNPDTEHPDSDEDYENQQEWVNLNAAKSAQNSPAVARRGTVDSVSRTPTIAVGALQQSGLSDIPARGGLQNSGTPEIKKQSKTKNSYLKQAVLAAAPNDSEPNYANFQTNTYYNMASEQQKMTSGTKH